MVAMARAVRKPEMVRATLITHRIGENAHDAATYAAVIACVFADEGGYTDEPTDPGGATQLGIAIADARKNWKADATTARPC
jgi:hypothetical protein